MQPSDYALCVMRSVTSNANDKLRPESGYLRLCGLPCGLLRNSSERWALEPCSPASFRAGPSAPEWRLINNRLASATTARKMPIDRIKWPLLAWPRIGLWRARKLWGSWFDTNHNLGLPAKTRITPLFLKIAVAVSEYISVSTSLLLCWFVGIQVYQVNVYIFR